jgi:hypothetical protein
MYDDMASESICARTLGSGIHVDNPTMKENYAKLDKPPQLLGDSQKLEGNDSVGLLSGTESRKTATATVFTLMV